MPCQRPMMLRRPGQAHNSTVNPKTNATLASFQSTGIGWIIAATATMKQALNTLLPSTVPRPTSS